MCWRLSLRRSQNEIKGWGSLSPASMVLRISTGPQGREGSGWGGWSTNEPQKFNISSYSQAICGPRAWREDRRPFLQKSVCTQLFGVYLNTSVLGGRRVVILPWPVWQSNKAPPQSKPTEEARSQSLPIILKCSYYYVEKQIGCWVGKVLSILNKHGLAASQRSERCSFKVVTRGMVSWALQQMEQDRGDLTSVDDKPCRVLRGPWPPFPLNKCKLAAKRFGLFCLLCWHIFSSHPNSQTPHSLGWGPLLGRSQE